MQDIKNKAGEVLGQYDLVEVTKPDTYEVKYINKAGAKLTKTVEVDKTSFAKLASQAFNTNIRNFVAGLARPKTGSKLGAYEAYFQKQGIDTAGIPVEKLIEKLKDLA